MFGGGHVYPTSRICKKTQIVKLEKLEKIPNKQGKWNSAQNWLHEKLDTTLPLKISTKWQIDKLEKLDKFPNKQDEQKIAQKLAW